jgi:hypothetical protein
MAKDAVATMGAVLPDDAGGRDAVHVAVFSAVCEQDLKPGQLVWIVAQGDPDTLVRAIGSRNAVGIADPFIDKTIPANKRFWVYLMPRTITALSHRWSHPAFEQAASSYVPPSQKLLSEKWLRDYCIRNDVPSYETFMQAVEHADMNDEYLHIDGQDASGAIPPELWVHVENILGEKLPAEKPKYFSCSC